MKANKNISEKVITKRFLNMVAKFNDDLKAFAEESGEEEATLYEDICTFFTLSNVHIEGDYFVYNFDGEENRDLIYRLCDAEESEEEGDYFSYVEEIKEDIKFWRACLRRAKKYLAMSGEELDAKEEAYLYGEGEEEGEEEANQEEAAEESAAAVSYQEAAAKAEESAKRAAEYQEAAKEAAAVAKEYNKEYVNIYSCIQAARSEAEKAEIKSRAAEIKTFAAKYQAKAEAFANQAAEAAAAANEAAYYMTKAAENWEEARRADILAESADKAADKAAEYQEAAADLIKTAAAVAFGFVGFYLTFAIFGI